MQDSVTTEKGLDEVPSNEVALRLLEEGKRVHIPNETKRVIPPKTKENEKKKNKRRKRRKRRGKGRFSLLTLRARQKGDPRRL